jgi:hypothetical protein
VSSDGSVTEEAYGVVYYGGVLDLRNATPVEVRSGETFAGADIPLGAGKMRASHIRGVVINGETGQPAAGAQVLAIPRQERPNALVLFGSTNSAGVFDLAGAVPDQYVLTATANSTVTTAGTVPAPFPVGALQIGSYTSSVGYVPVDVGNSDAAAVRIVTTSGFAVAGQVVIEGKSTREAEPDLVKMHIGLTRDPDLIGMPGPLMLPPPPQPGTPPPPGFSPPKGMPPGNGQVTASGDFKFVVSPGDFRILVNGMPANAYVKSIRMAGDDLLRSGFHITKAADNAMQIVIGTDGGSIGGSVVDENLNPFLNATVALVPESQDPRLRPELYRSTTSDSSGNFQLNTIPPGNYKLFAWEWAEPDSWQYADFIRAYESLGKTVPVTASGKMDKVQLNVIRTHR